MRVRVMCMQYNGSHRTNYNALVSAGFASHTMLCPGFMLDQPFDRETSTPPIERECLCLLVRRY